MVASGNGRTNGEGESQEFDAKIRVGNQRTGTTRSLNLRVEGTIPSRLTTFIPDFSDPELADARLKPKLKPKPQNERCHTPFIDILRTVFPVVALEAPGQMARMDFFGTAFAVALGVFMTAAHVVESASEKGELALAGPAPPGSGLQPLGSTKVEHVEVFKERDIALLWCNVGNATVLNTWRIDRAQVLTDASAFGYPHAVTWSPTGDRLEVVIRAYKGHVITTRGFERLPGSPAVYEISCAFPQGMSGAPLLMQHGTTLIVLGVVLGIDTVTYGGVKQDVGIAVMGEEIFHLHSRRLDGSLAERLALNGAQLVAVPIDPTQG